MIKLRNCLNLLIIFYLIATPVSATAEMMEPKGFFVSPDGDDEKEGTTPSDAFKTLERARRAVQNSEIKTVYLMNGVYMLTEPLVLANKDGGETWTSYPGQRAILDGQDKIATAISITTSDRTLRTQNITIKDIDFRRFTKQTITVWSAANILIEGNKIYDGAGMGVVLLGADDNIVIRGNHVSNIAWRAIQVGNDPFNKSCTNIIIDKNEIFDVNKMEGLLDTGAIYIIDRAYQQRNISVSRNVIINYGHSNSNSGARAIYLDDEASYVTVFDNYVSGKGGFAVQFHGGNDNLVHDNVFDISQSSQGIGAYEDVSRQNFPNYGMRNNAFIGNTIIQSCHTMRAAQKLWQFFEGQKGSIAKLTRRNNIYYNIPQSAVTIEEIPDSSAQFVQDCAIGEKMQVKHHQ